MGKLADLSSIKTAKSDSFVYTVPMAAFDAIRIMVIYTDANAARISEDLLSSVLRGLRRANPTARILIIEETQSERITRLIDDNMRATTTDELIMTAYHNQWPGESDFPTLTAPEYVEDYDCCISLCALDVGNGQVKASVDNLRALIDHEAHPEEELTTLRPEDLYFTYGFFFDGAVIELDGQIVWGDNLLGADETAARIANVPKPDYLASIRAHQDVIEMP